MPPTFPAPPAIFVGRDEYVARFAARLEHFRFFLYGGISGIGKTSLILKLARETRSADLRGAVYLPLWPSESITSILARVEAQSSRQAAFAAERQGDPYSRLADFLDNKHLVLLLDDIQHLRREDLLSLLRAVRINRGNYRVIAAGGGDPELSAIERMEIHMERLGPLSAEEVRKVAASYSVRGDIAELLSVDAARGGCCGHPLTLRFLLALHGQDLPPPEFFAGQSSRSVSAFRTLLSRAAQGLDPKQVEALAGMSRVGLAIDKGVATRAFGQVVPSLAKRGLLMAIGKQVAAHELVGQALPDQVRVISESAARAVAKHLKDDGVALSEPMRILRAAELLAHVGASNDAVDTLTNGWEMARDFGFLEAYLKSVASIPSTPALERRLRLLSARARMRQGNAQAVREEIEQLATDRDSWTRSRALAALTFIYSQVGEPERVVGAYEALRKTSVGNELLVPAAALTAVAMVRIGKIKEAEKLARAMLGKLHGKQTLAREGELRRLLARIYSQSGNLTDAVHEATAAAKAFEQSGDLYHAAMAQGFVGDLYRETGDFELAKSAFTHYKQLAEKWGDRDLVHVAELADAWVSLDIGDITHAARQVAAVEKELGAAPSRRLKRYLAAARALLDAGRGKHRAAAVALERVVEAWDTSGQQAVADMLRAQRVRSLIASNDLDKARELVDRALSRLDPKTEAPRLATFLRESALIRLRRKEGKRAMAELAQARKLFANSGIRREEALTLYRIAHAALEEGDVALAGSAGREALALARKIKHTRAIALSRELQGRIALIQDEPATAVTATREALQSLRKLGDELGTLHVSESLLRALIVAGDLAGAIRLGPKVSEQADRLEIREVRVRAIVLTGIALLRRGRVEAATRCFRELPDQALGPLTSAFMWRLGEGLASVTGAPAQVLERRANWVAAVRRMPQNQQEIARHLIEQLELPPRERCSLRMRGAQRQVGTEEIAWIEPQQFDLYVDVHNKQLYDGGAPVDIELPELRKLFNRLVVAAPKPVSIPAAYQTLYGNEPADKPDQKVKASLKQLQKSLKGARHVNIVSENGGLRLVPPQRYAFVVPRSAEMPELGSTQKKILRLLRRFGTMPLQAIQEDCKLSRSAARREVGALVKHGVVQTVRDGRGQAFKLV